MTHSLISKPNFRALAIGAATFATLYWISSIGLSKVLNWWYYPTLPNNLPYTISSSWLWRLLGWALYIVPGFVAGFIARRSGLMHGAIVGVLTAPIMAVFVYMVGFWSAIEFSSLIYGAVLGIIWCSLSGLVGEFVVSRVFPQ